jgi:hypothetical protein
MEMYSETLKLAWFTERRFLPLHRKLQTLYRKNKSIQSQNKKLKEEFHPFKDDLSQRNINVLAQVAIEINGLAVERSDPRKEGGVVVIEGSSPATRRSARLRN